MNINKIGKFSLVAMTMAVMTACSSVGSDTDETSTTDQETAGTAVQESNGQYEAEQIALAKNVYYFDFDQATISAEDREILAVRAFILSRSPNAKIRLEGHASEEGTREYNITLGERRGDAIAMYLMANGVASSQIEVVSYGEERPAVTGSTEEARSKNRRVEIK